MTYYDMIEDCVFFAKNQTYLYSTWEVLINQLSNDIFLVY